MQYASTKAEWDKVVEICRRRKKLGFDTETYGHDIRKTSPAHRARIHVWSLAVLTDKMHPRGYRRARGVMLPVAALEHRPIVDLLEDPAIEKLAHNKSHDDHSLRNHGVRLDGCRDTLPHSRILFVDEESHSLKPLMERKLGRKVMTFEWVVTEPNEVTVEKKSRRKTCSCGDASCRLRKGHTKSVIEEVQLETLVRGTREIPLETIVPGHPRFTSRLQPYAIQDAEGAVELDDYTERVEPIMMRERGDVPVPWGDEC